MTSKSFEFTAAVRGYHVYGDIWLPSINETLKCMHELGNAYDVFAIKCMKGNRIVGHLLREISRPTKYLLDRGAIITAIITSEHYRKSPLFQGGLEIRCLVRVTVIATVRGHLLIKRYGELVEALYTEPKDEVIVGSYLKPNVSLVNGNSRVPAKRNKDQKTKRRGEM